MGVNEPNTPIANDLLGFLGNYYDSGEFGVIFEMKQFPQWLVKVVNLDADDDENLVNQEQALFMEQVFEIGNEGGVPNLIYYKELALNKLYKNHIKNILLRGNYFKAIEVLNMEEGDMIAIWIMEKLEHIGEDENLTNEENAHKVGEAAALIFENYGFIVEDLHSNNYGQTVKGDWVILDPQILTEPPNEVFLMDNEQLVNWFIKNKVWLKDGKASTMIRN